MTSGTYYGLSWNTSNLGGNNYVNFIIVAAIEVPAHMLQFFMLDRWGRKPVVCVSMLLAGTSLICTLCISTGESIQNWSKGLRRSDKNRNIRIRFSNVNVNIVFADMQWLVVVLAMIGKFAITTVYDAIYIFSAELFPTAVRNAGLGACSTAARLGGVAAPYINLLVSFINYDL